LPTIEKANETLEVDGETIEDIDEEEEHVEMVRYCRVLLMKNLGLGVLEERRNESEEEEEEEEEENIFDKLLRRTKDPIRSVLIRTLNDEDIGPPRGDVPRRKEENDAGDAEEDEEQEEENGANDEEE
jgi:hypothetical protein